jgi:peroxiredoxin
MKIIAKILLVLLCAGLTVSRILPAGQKDSDSFRVSLHRVDGVIPWSYGGFIFEADLVAAVQKKHPIKLPSPLPEGAVLGYTPAGPLYALKMKTPDGTRMRLLLDADADFDLTNNAWLELPAVEDADKATIVPIARRFDGASPRIEQLPYRIWYIRSEGRDGRIEDDIYFATDYVYKGEFRRNGKDYTLDLVDGDAQGRFIREKMTSVNFIIAEKGDISPKKVLRFFELFLFEKALYKVKDNAEDGRWMEFAPSGLEATMLGKPAPDFEMRDSTGKIFRLSEYKGKVLLLDFWFAGCKPCIAKFPSIKKKLDSLSDKPFAVIGINIDTAPRIEQAKKVIVDNGLTWRQVVEGKGEYIPAYQVFGRLPEMPMTFPIYVAIDEAGVSRYATNDFDKMSLFLDAGFNDPAGPQNTMFVPLSHKYGPEPKTQPLNAVDFTGPRVKELIASGKLKMPAIIPPGTRIGLLTNGKALLVAPGPASDELRLIVDTNHDFDLNAEKEYTLPVSPDPRKSTTGELRTKVEGGRIPWASGGIAFFPMFFSAKRAADGGTWPEVFIEGYVSFFEGAFTADGAEYLLETSDLNGDRIVNEFDTTQPGFLKLKIRKGEEWIQVHEGTSHIPIGGAFFRLRRVSDDGFLVELEKER